MAYVAEKISRRLEGDELVEFLAVLRREYHGQRVNGFPVWCRTCLDSGWVFEGGRRPVPCTSCPDVAERQSRARLGALAVAGLSSDREPRSLERFDLKYQDGPGRREAHEAFEAVRDWCGDGPLSLLLLGGPTGVGKTHLCEGAADLLIRADRRVIYVTGPRFTHQMRPRSDTEGGIEGTQFAFRERLMSVAWLILDEVGSAHDPSGWVAANYQDIVLHRVQNSLPTLLAGNIGKQDETGREILVELLGDRLASRLLEGRTGRIASMWQCCDVRQAVAFRGRRA